MSLGSFESFLRFTAAKSKRIRAVARATMGEYSEEDVTNEAWLMAFEVAEKLGVPVDFDDESFQQNLIAFLYQELVRYSETTVRHALKLDRPIHGEAVSIDDHPAMRQLASSEYSDPLHHLIELEAAEEDREPSPHESRAGAYVRLLEHCGYSMHKVAYSLLISLSYCYRRLNEARLMCERQLVLPQGISGTDDSFIPGPWRPFKIRRVWVQGELDLDLDDSGNLW
jgi:DNA-directed RNA polymerase specialized sigma24 family protein